MQISVPGVRGGGVELGTANKSKELTSQLHCSDGEGSREEVAAGGIGHHVEHGELRQIRSRDILIEGRPGRPGVDEFIRGRSVLDLFSINDV